MLSGDTEGGKKKIENSEKVRVYLYKIGNILRAVSFHLRIMTRIL